MGRGDCGTVRADRRPGHLCNPEVFFVLHPGGHVFFQQLLVPRRIALGLGAGRFGRVQLTQSGLVIGLRRFHLGLGLREIGPHGLHRDFVITRIDGDEELPCSDGLIVLRVHVDHRTVDP